MKTELKYYPCVCDCHGRILKKMTVKPMTREDAELFLKRMHSREWLNCDAIPQPENTRGLH